MQPDRQKYPDIPDGAQLSYNAKTQTYQVFREYYEKDETGKRTKKKESIGVINREGVFSFGKYYTACQEIAALKQQLKELKADSKRDFKTQTKQMTAIQETVQKCCESSELDSRQPCKITFPMDSLAVISLLCALKGDTDCVSLAEYYNTNFNWLKAYLLDDNSPKTISHDTFRKQLLLIDTKRFESFYCDLSRQLIELNSKKIRVIACDGQAVRATGRRSRQNSDIHGIRYFMNIYDTASQICLCHGYIPEKKNEISIGPSLLNGLDIKGAVVTADALNTQVCFVDSILKAEAEYCLAVKENQEKTYDEIRCLFNTVNPDHIFKHEFDWEADHGRVERRTVEAISGRFLSKEIKEKWSHLAEGSVIKVTCDRTIKASATQSLDDRFYISSMPLDQYSVKQMGEVVRQHWAVENKLHYMMDVNFSQDRISCSNINYLANRTSLNNLAAAIIYRYQDHLAQKNEVLSFRQIQTRLENPKIALEAIYVALGLK